ncbi:MAG: hypothetical protein IPJ69_13040 [Deltaproteobacteria bacterium]|nr:MAG: hypothetical protein IPJ69_13040 [Deltaproteobacteria bacterium]
MNTFFRSVILASSISFGCGAKTALEVPDPSQSCSDERSFLSPGIPGVGTLNFTSTPPSALVYFTWSFPTVPREFRLELARGSNAPLDDIPQCEPAQITEPYHTVSMIPLSNPPPASSQYGGVRVYFTAGAPQCLRVIPLYNDCTGPASDPSPVRLGMR